MVCSVTHHPPFVTIMTLSRHAPKTVSPVYVRSLKQNNNRIYSFRCGIVINGDRL
ncbi:MAG: hypothetical protein WBA41_12580 [Rivularia sp. (in: cyanobacteria)]